MPRLLKQSTAVTFRIGPFVDSTDAVTPETALTIAQADIQISKADGAFAQTSATTPTTTHDADGWYQCPLTATDTGTLGMLTVQIAMSGALPVWEHFMVVSANIYDSLISGTDLVDVNVAQWNGTALSTTNPLPNAAAGANGGLPTVNASNYVAGIQGTINTLDALDTAQDTQHGTTQSAIAALNDLDGAGIRTAVGLASANLDTQLGTIDSNVDAVLVDTGTTLETHLTDIKGATFSGATDSLEAIRDRGDAAWITGPTAAAVRAEIDSNSTQLAAIVADTNELQTDLADGGRIDLLVDGIKAVTDALPDSGALTSIATAAALATVGGNVDTIVASTLSTAAAAQLEQNLNNCFTGTASGTPATTTMVSDIAVTVDDQFKGRIITFDDDTTTAALRGQATDITACTAASNTLTFTALTTAPVSGDTFTIT